MGWGACLSGCCLLMVVDFVDMFAEYGSRCGCVGYVLEFFGFAWGLL